MLQISSIRTRSILPAIKGTPHSKTLFSLAYCGMYSPQQIQCDLPRFGDISCSSLVCGAQSDKNDVVLHSFLVTKLMGMLWYKVVFNETALCLSDTDALFGKIQHIAVIFWQRLFLAHCAPQTKCHWPLCWVYRPLQSPVNVQLGCDLDHFHTKTIQ